MYIKRDSARFSSRLFGKIELIIKKGKIQKIVKHKRNGSRLKYFIIDDQNKIESRQL